MFKPSKVVLLTLGLAFIALAAEAQWGPTKVRYETVKKQSFQDMTEALGTLKANESVVLTVNVTETITAIYFDDGERVTPGDVVVQMTSEEEQALLVEARTNAREAKRQLDRISALVAAGTASESLLDQRRRDYDAAAARLAATQSRLRDRVVKAPFSGRLGLRNISLGALVQPGDVITTLTDDSQMKLDFTVPATYLSSLEEGLSVVAKTRAYPSREFSGVVKSINNLVDPVTRAVTVRAIIPNNDLALKPGLLMKIVLYMNPREGLSVPEGALLPEGEKNFVMVAVQQDEQWVAERREVTIASRRLGEVEVISGVQEGDRVITDGAFKLRPGAPIVLSSSQDDVAQVRR